MWKNLGCFGDLSVILSPSPQEAQIIYDKGYFSQEKKSKWVWKACKITKSQYTLTNVLWITFFMHLKLILNPKHKKNQMGTDWTSNQTWLPSILVNMCALFWFFFSKDLLYHENYRRWHRFHFTIKYWCRSHKLEKNNTIKTCEKSIRFLR